MTVFRSLFLLFALALLVPGAHAQAVEASGDGFESESTRTFDVSPGGTLELTTRNGSIDVSAWDQSQVRVVETVRMRRFSSSDASKYVQEYTTEYANANGVVRVEGPRNERSGVRRDFEVRVPRRFNADVRTAGGGITLEGIEGTVTGKTSGGSIDAERITGRVEISTSGGSLNIGEIDGPVSGATSGGSIDVRDVTGSVEVRTAGGSIELRSVGGDVEARTAGGSIEAAGIDGRLELKTAGGDIDVSDAAQDVTAQTAGGDVDAVGIGGRLEARTMGGDVSARDVTGNVTAQTNAGDVEIDGVAGSVEARTSVGDVEVRVTATTFDRDPALDLTAHHGDIRVMLPAGVQASVDAEVESYHGGVDRDDVYSDFPLTRQDGRSGRLRATGDLNGGGPSILLRSSGGSIRIEKDTE